MWKPAVKEKETIGCESTSLTATSGYLRRKATGKCKSSDKNQDDLIKIFSVRVSQGAQLQRPLTAQRRKARRLECESGLTVNDSGDDEPDDETGHDAVRSVPHVAHPVEVVQSVPATTHSAAHTELVRWRLFPKLTMRAPSGLEPKRSGGLFEMDPPALPQGKISSLCTVAHEKNPFPC